MRQVLVVGPALVLEESCYRFSSGCSLSVPQGKQTRLEKAILVVVVGWCCPYSPLSEGLLLTKLTLRSIYGGILGLVAVPRLGLYN